MNSHISANILRVMEINNCSVAEAIDVVLGKGTYAKVAGDLYDALRAA